MNSDTEDEDLTIAPPVPPVPKSPAQDHLGSGHSKLVSRELTFLPADTTSDEDEDLNIDPGKRVVVSKRELSEELFAFAPLPHPIARVETVPRSVDSPEASETLPGISLDSDEEGPSAVDPESERTLDELLDTTVNRPIKDTAAKNEGHDTQHEKPAFSGSTPPNPKTDVLIGCKVMLA